MGGRNDIRRQAQDYRRRRGGEVRRPCRDESRQAVYREHFAAARRCSPTCARACASSRQDPVSGQQVRQPEMMLMRMFPRSPPIWRTAPGARAIALALVIIAGGEAFAQSTVTGPPNAMQGFSQNRDQPIQIEAATLEMRDKKKEATFTGNVKVVQGDTTMTSKILVVFYESAAAPAAPAPVPGNTKGAKSAPAPIQAATPGPGGSSSIRRLEAKGSVVVTQKDQVVTGETAIFDTKANLITMTGGVVLTQCKNVLRGDRLLVDMTTGVSRVESDSGKVQGLFDQSDKGCGGAAGGPPGPPKPGIPSLIPGKK